MILISIYNIIIKLYISKSYYIFLCIIFLFISYKIMLLYMPIYAIKICCKYKMFLLFNFVF